ncbi:hypothetical protein AA313_de0205473 [Arthrobotrys entomopaga]|nr:hypothetical protein AA313_de0205473 [Arthrobotrys entomopaga]
MVSITKWTGKIIRVERFDESVQTKCRTNDGVPRLEYIIISFLLSVMNACGPHDSSVIQLRFENRDDDEDQNDDDAICSRNQEKLRLISGVIFFLSYITSPIAAAAI